MDVGCGKYGARTVLAVRGYGEAVLEGSDGSDGGGEDGQRESDQDGGGWVVSVPQDWTDVFWGWRWGIRKKKARG